MALSYGKRPKFARRNGGAARTAPRHLRVKLNGRHDLEQMSFLLQKIIARLQDHGVHSVESCALYLPLLGRDGAPMALMDRASKPLETIEISLPVSARFTKATND